LLRIVARLANDERGKVRCQRAGIGDAHGQALEQFDFLGQRHGFADAFRFSCFPVHRPIDKNLVEAAHNH
jgi:hypothetical protein